MSQIKLHDIINVHVSTWIFAYRVGGSPFHKADKPSYRGILIKAS